MSSYQRLVSVFIYSLVLEEYNNFYRNDLKIRQRNTYVFNFNYIILDNTIFITFGNFKEDMKFLYFGTRRSVIINSLF